MQRLFNVLDHDIQYPRGPSSRLSNRKYRLLLEFFLLTGIRRKGGRSLTAGQVDAQAGVIFLENVEPKTFRMVPVHTRVGEILRELAGGSFQGIRPSSASHKFKCLWKRAGQGAGFKLHSLRQTSATSPFERGAGITVVQQLLSHAHLQTTMI